MKMWYNLAICKLCNDYCNIFHYKNTKTAKNGAPCGYTEGGFSGFLGLFYGVEK